jgi:O-succinylbenzoic acid--CoA ligase
MEQNAQRELLAANPEWSVRELMARLATALASQGPALSLGQSATSLVSGDISLVVATTGSSGVAKEVGLSAAALVASAQGSNKYLTASHGDTWSLLLPATHIAGINVLIRCLELGTDPVDLRKPQGPYPKVDFTAIVPTHLFRALKGDSKLMKHLVDAKAVLVGGAALSDELRKEAIAAGINIVTTYGMTETSGGCVYNGQVLDGVEIKIVEENRIAIKGKVLATSYINAESTWAKEMHNGWFFTSDFGKIENDKLIVEGRLDDVLIAGGVNLSIAAIERFIQNRYPALTFAAFGVKNPEWGDSLHLAIAGDVSANEKEITEFLVEEFGAVAKPRGFLALPELPLIGIGKVDRKKLAELALEENH